MLLMGVPPQVYRYIAPPVSGFNDIRDDLIGPDTKGTPMATSK